MSIDLDQAVDQPVTEPDGSIEDPMIELGELNDIDRARRLAEAHRLPLVDLAVTGVSPDAIKMVPLKVLERVVAIPSRHIAGFVSAAPRPGTIATAPSASTLSSVFGQSLK